MHHHPRNRERALNLSILSVSGPDLGFPGAARRVMGITPPDRQSASFMVGTTTPPPERRRRRAAKRAVRAPGGPAGRRRPANPDRPGSFTTPTRGSGIADATVAAWQRRAPAAAAHRGADAAAGARPGGEGAATRGRETAADPGGRPFPRHRGQGAGTAAQLFSEAAAAAPGSRHAPFLSFSLAPPRLFLSRLQKPAARLGLTRPRSRPGPRWGSDGPGGGAATESTDTRQTPRPRTRTLSARSLGSLGSAAAPPPGRCSRPAHPRGTTRTEAGAYTPRVLGRTPEGSRGHTAVTQPGTVDEPLPAAGGTTPRPRREANWKGDRPARTPTPARARAGPPGALSDATRKASSIANGTAPRPCTQHTWDYTEEEEEGAREPREAADASSSLASPGAHGERRRQGKSRRRAAGRPLAASPRFLGFLSRRRLTRSKVATDRADGATGFRPPRGDRLPPEKPGDGKRRGKKSTRARGRPSFSCSVLATAARGGARAPHSPPGGGDAANLSTRPPPSRPPATTQKRPGPVGCAALGAKPRRRGRPDRTTGHPGRAALAPAEEEGGARCRHLAGHRLLCTIPQGSLVGFSGLPARPPATGVARLAPPRRRRPLEAGPRLRAEEGRKRKGGRGDGVPPPRPRERGSPVTERLRQSGRAEARPHAHRRSPTGRRHLDPGHLRRSREAAGPEPRQAPRSPGVRPAALCLLAGCRSPATDRAPRLRCQPRPGSSPASRASTAQGLQAPRSRRRTRRRRRLAANRGPGSSPASRAPTAQGLPGPALEEKDEAPPPPRRQPRARKLAGFTGPHSQGAPGPALQDEDEAPPPPRRQPRARKLAGFTGPHTAQALSPKASAMGKKGRGLRRLAAIRPSRLPGPLGKLAADAGSGWTLAGFTTDVAPPALVGPKSRLSVFLSLGSRFVSLSLLSPLCRLAPSSGTWQSGAGTKPGDSSPPHRCAPSSGLPANRELASPAARGSHGDRPVLEPATATPSRSTARLVLAQARLQGRRPESSGEAHGGWPPFTMTSLEAAGNSDPLEQTPAKSLRSRVDVLPDVQPGPGRDAGPKASRGRRPAARGQPEPGRRVARRPEGAGQRCRREDGTCREDLVPESRRVDLLPGNGRVDLVPESRRVDLVLYCRRVDLVSESRRVDLVLRSRRVDLVPGNGRVDLVPESRRVDLVPGSRRVDLVPGNGRVDLVPYCRRVDLVPYCRRNSGHS
ncbi:collagen, type I, alpha 1a-like [Pithys albifrons albifrons]|uniref:collagen, type I, alpha 1a-like n=1 Tax=Pithys albifrons albifrons TaxID=3385563 RepID=UPI003A5CAA7E